MDPNPRLRSALKRAGLAYQAGLIDRAAIDRVRTRVTRVREQWRALKRRRVRQHHRRVADHALDLVRRALREGGTIIAYDCEYVSRSPALQLGIAIWSRGRITTRTYTVPSYDKPVTSPSRFGADRYVSEAYLVTLAQRLYRRHAVHAFHGGSAEIAKLGLSGNHPGHVDTSEIGHGLISRGQRPGLAALCRHFGIDPTGHHNAGNDARFTLDVLLALAALPDTDWHIARAGRARHATTPDSNTLHTMTLGGS